MVIKKHLAHSKRYVQNLKQFSKHLDFKNILLAAWYRRFSISFESFTALFCFLVRSKDSSQTWCRPAEFVHCKSLRYLISHLSMHCGAVEVEVFFFCFFPPRDHWVITFQGMCCLIMWLECNDDTQEAQSDLGPTPNKDTSCFFVCLPPPHLLDSHLQISSHHTSICIYSNGCHLELAHVSLNLRWRIQKVINAVKLQYGVPLIRMIMRLQRLTGRTSWESLETTETFLAHLVWPTPIWQEEPEKVQGVTAQNLVS